MKAACGQPGRAQWLWAGRYRSIRCWPARSGRSNSGASESRRRPNGSLSSPNSNCPETANADGVETWWHDFPRVSLDAIPGAHWDHEPLMRKTLPLTPALSPGERENRRQIPCNRKFMESSRARNRWAGGHNPFGINPFLGLALIAIVQLWAMISHPMKRGTDGRK